MRQPKEVILEALRKKLEGASDDLIRIKLYCKRTPKPIDEPYDPNGNSLRQILSKEEEKQLELKNAIMWANTL